MVVFLKVLVGAGHGSLGGEKPGVAGPVSGGDSREVPEPGRVADHCPPPSITDREPSGSDDPYGPLETSVGIPQGMGTLD